MTATLAPGLLIGSAPPANAPPGPQTSGASSKSTSTSTGDQAPPGSFAALLQTVTQQGAAAQTGGGPGVPPNGGTPTSEGTPTVADLLAQLMALAQGIEGTGDTSDAATETKTNLLLDRLAEAGGLEDQVDGAAGVVEALMAYLVMGQPTKVETDTVNAVPVDLAALIQGLEDALSASGTTADEVAAMLAAGSAMQGQASTGIDGDAIDAGAALAAAAEIIGDAAPADGEATDLVGAAASDTSESGEPMPTVLEPVSTTDGDLTAVEPSGDAPAEPVTKPFGAASAVEPRDGDRERVATELPAPARNETGRIDVTPSSTAATEAAAVAAATSPQPTASAPSVEVVSRVVATEATVPADVADVVLGASLGGDSEVRLVLNPPELGHLDIHIARGEHGLRITLEAAQAGARELLDRSMAGLHQALEARDLRVDRLEVRSTDTGRGSLDTSAGGQQSGGGAFSGSQGDDTPEWSPVAMFERMSEPAALPEQPGTAPSSMGTGSVDVLA